MCVCIMITIFFTFRFNGKGVCLELQSLIYSYRMADFERRLEVRHINTMIHNIIVYQSLAIIIFSFECVVGYVNSVTPDHQTKLKK